ncbi:MAG: hypothetical protein K8S87_05570 [Planctomycetes bacterium]|nr:hypothetical protein [Planctomycetota bacterium]
MFRYLLASAVLTCLLLAHTVISQVEPKTDEKKPQNETKEKPEVKKPAKSYDLKPVFNKGTVWSEEVSIKSILEYSYGNDYSSTVEDSVALKMKVKFTESKNNIPTKIKYYNCDGKGNVIEKYSDSSEYTYEYSVKSGYVEADIQEDLTLKITKNNNMRNDILLVHPCGNIAWFDPPVRAVKVGDTWKSNMLPINQAAFDKDSEKFEDIKGKFKLDKVGKSKDNEIAHIVWEGTCKLSSYKNSGPFDVKWSVKIKYDLTNKRVISSDGESTAEIGKVVKGGLKLYVNKKCIYDEKSKPDPEDKPIKPKADDDE